MKAEDLEQMIYKYCRLRKITHSQFLETMKQILKENTENTEITMAKIVELMDNKIKQQGENK